MFVYLARKDQAVYAIFSKRLELLSNIVDGIFGKLTMLPQQDDTVKMSSDKLAATKKTPRLNVISSGRSFGLSALAPTELWRHLGNSFVEQSSRTV